MVSVIVDHRNVLRHIISLNELSLDAFTAGTQATAYKDNDLEKHRIAS